MTLSLRLRSQFTLYCKILMTQALVKWIHMVLWTADWFYPRVLNLHTSDRTRLLCFQHAFIKDGSLSASVSISLSVCNPLLTHLAVCWNNKPSAEIGSGHSLGCSRFVCGYYLIALCQVALIMFGPSCTGVHCSHPTFGMLFVLYALVVHVRMCVDRCMAVCINLCLCMTMIELRRVLHETS